MAEVIGTQGELFRELKDPAHILRSALAAARGKRRLAPVARFLLDLEPECFRIAAEIEAGTWCPGEYRSFWIREPKLRLITAAPFRDRAVHHAIVSLLEPHFERRFVAHSYACRRGKGTHAALERAHRLARRFPFVLRGDIVQFFPSIDRGVLKAVVRRSVQDERFLAILERVLDLDVVPPPLPHELPDGQVPAVPVAGRGLPIGNLTSQFLANVLLDLLDHRVMDDLGFGAYVRYCDDFLVFGRSRSALAALRAAAAACLETLGLRLHERKGGVHSTRSPLPFLGFAIRPASRRLKRPGVVRATRRLKALAFEVQAGRLPAEKLTASVRAWCAHAAWASTSGIRRRVLEKAGLGRGPQGQS
jgi:RNA-directed DNA polymerase